MRERRVSTKNHGQTTDTQALALQEYVAHRGFTIVEEYRDEGISGSKDSRPALDRLMKDARARKFDVVIDREKVCRSAAEGKSIKAIARENGIARATVRSIPGKPRVAEIPH